MRTALYGLQVTIVGMLVVFAGLIILVYAIGLLRRVIGEKKTKKVAQPEIRVAPADEEYAEVADAAADGALIAVITAAVAAAMEAQAEAEAVGGFVVRSIRRVHRTPAWNRAGREEQIYGRL